MIQEFFISKSSELNALQGQDIYFHEKLHNYTEKANGHHVDGLQLEVLQGPHLLFDIDLHLNQGLLPTKYFQKYHHKVNFLLVYGTLVLFNVKA